MALIAMAVHDTPDNNRAPLTKRTLESLKETVDFSRHRICIVVNAATDDSRQAIQYFQHDLPFPWNLDAVIWNAENVGTARAINQAWKTRQPGEVCIKMDNDVVIHRAGWVDEMEECIDRLPKIGIIGLKRKDLLESPNSRDLNFRSTLHEVPHQSGQKNLYIERVNHVMGTCQAFNPALLDKIGYLYQPGLYGYDDSLAAIRCQVAGFISCFLCGVEIDHIDPGGTNYQKWKEGSAWNDHAEYNRLKAGYQNGTISIYYDADGNNPPVVGNYKPYTATSTNYSTR